MRKVDIVFIFTSLFVGVIAYLVSSLLIMGISVFLVYAVYYLMFIRKKIKIYLSKINQIHCCYHFINSFIITLSVKESIDDAYESGIRLNNKEFNEETEGLQSMPVYDRVVYLRKYFNLAVYKMFINVFDLYQDQGGNIINLSDALMRETTRTERSLAESKSIGEKRLVEFIILWILSFAVLLFLRFGISEFYVKMLSSTVFVVMIVIFFLLVLISIHLFVINFVDLSIKEDNVE